jgi:Tfp pilus assembly protein PilO
MLSRISSKLSASNKNIIVGLVFVGVIALFYFTVTYSYLPRYHESKNRVDQLTLEVARLGATKAAVLRLEEEVKKSTQQLDREMERLNWDVLLGEPSLIIGTIDGAEEVRLTDLRFSPKAAKGPIWEQPISVTAIGAYLDVFNYLQSLDSQEKALQLRKMIIEIPFSAWTAAKDEVILELELLALGAIDYQPKASSVTSAITLRENIFQPDIRLTPVKPNQPSSSPSIPSPSNQYHFNAGKETLPDLGPRPVPRYDFPDVKELEN